ncbi:MAG: YihA family ribosome biogenesis GTP-binding protein [Clostridia bacterium]|nr:YihA family ribosome biogenesis GTP-binding protein [Clostridia bacterium]
MNTNVVTFEAAYGTVRQLPASDLPEIAFSGRSNVGKSTLLNKLMNRKALARVSSTPGKTVTANFFRGDGVRFVDLPGYGFAKVGGAEKQRWADLMEGYFRSGRAIRLVVQLLDMRYKPSADDMTKLQFLQSSGTPYVLVLTKSDKLNKTQYRERLAAFGEELAFLGDVPRIPFSALNGEGVEQLRSVIDHALNPNEV